MQPILSEKLNKSQLEAVLHEAGPLMIIAGAGSGKTHTLTTKIRYLVEKGVDPQSILAITFTNKAAREMRERLSGLGDKMWIATFHAFGARILRAEARHFERGLDFTIFDDSDQASLIKKIIKKLNIEKGEKYAPAPISYMISKVKNSNLRDADPIMDNIYKEYEEALQKNNAFDFDDLILKPLEVFQKDERVLEKYRAKFKYVLVDEFQDTSSTQYKLVKLLALEHRNLTIVGDDAQSIYSWRHADYRIFLNFEKDWPGAKVVILNENYRSTSTIIEAAESVIMNNKEQKVKNLFTKNDQGGFVTVMAAESEYGEAYYVVSKILDIVRGGGKLKDIAILYRTNAQSRAMEQILIKNSVAYKIFGGIKFYERKEIKDLLAGLRVMTNHGDEPARDRLEKEMGKRFMAKIWPELLETKPDLSPVELINVLLQKLNYISYLRDNYENSEDRLDNVKELLRFAKIYSEPGMRQAVTVDPETLDEIDPEGSGMSVRGGTTAFLEEVALNQAQDEGLNGVNLMTIHLAKGLEFNYVFVVGCTEGILPHERSYKSNEGIAEERRLMYVAMTRAKKSLFLTLHETPSRFLNEIPGNLVVVEDGGYGYSQNKNRRDYRSDEDDFISYE